MSRTTLCVITAAGLAAVSIGVMALRLRVLGDEVRVPKGPGAWKVTLKVSGKSNATDARLTTATPLDFGHQHISHVRCQSNELSSKPPAARHPERRQVLWAQRAGVAPGAFTAHYDFYCRVDVHHPTVAMNRLAESLYQPPAPGAYLQNEPRLDCDQPEVSALGRRLAAGRSDAGDQVEALFHYVDNDVAKEPALGGVGGDALECLKSGSGDAAAKSRLLVALCRNRGIPARLVTGLRLTTGPDQVAHVWAEAWVHDHWLPMCAYNHHYGHVPPTYLVFGFGDFPVARGRGVCDLSYAFLVERANAAMEADDPTPLRQALHRLALSALPPPETRLVEFLLLLPIAALIVCVYRQMIGVASFGTFAPALVGLAFREVQSLPGIVVFLGIVLLGWGMRRVLDRYHLLQVPRTALMLSLVVLVLIGAVVAANLKAPPVEATKYIPLFPMVILTGMIERFWTLEVEDGAASSFRTLLGTLVIAGSIALFLTWPLVVNHMLLFPETLGLIMAAQLLIGRYTGFRLSELLRFRDFLRPSET